MDKKPYSRLPLGEFSTADTVEPCRIAAVSFHLRFNRHRAASLRMIFGISTFLKDSSPCPLLP